MKRRAQAARVRLRFAPAVGVFGLLPTAGAAGQVVTDGSMGPAVVLIAPSASVGQNVLIGAELGQLRGGNLFHSFRQFDLRSASPSTVDIVRFTAPPESAAGITHVIARVTGGTPSLVDGQLRSEIPGASFLLVNPSGIQMGRNARVQLAGGSFVATTADVIRLADGGAFDARNADPSATTLTSAPPVAFGFLGAAPPAKINVKTRDFRLTPEGGSAGRVISFVGGDVEADFVRTTRTVAGAAVRPARVNAVAVASAGEVTLSPTDVASAVALSGFSALGDVSVFNGDGLEASDAVVIRGRDMVLERSNVRTSSDVSGTHGVDIALTGQLLLTSDRPVNQQAFPTIIETLALGAVRAGDVTISAGTVRLDPRAGTKFRNPAADIRGGGTTAVRSASNAGGVGGNVRVNAADSIVVNGAGEFSSTTRGSDPAEVGGEVRLTAGREIVLQGGKSQPYGRTELNTAGDVSVDLNDAAEVFTRAAGESRGGDVVIDTPLLHMGGERSGGGGVATLRTEAQVTPVLAAAAGDGIRPTVLPGSPALTPDPGNVATTGGGAGGAIRIVRAGSVVRMLGNSTIVSAAGHGGRGGDVVITAGALELDGAGVAGGGAAALIRSSTAGDGAGGSISVNVTGSVGLVGNAQISSGTNVGAGRAGDVTVAADAIALDGAGLAAGAAIFSHSQPEGTGAAGDVAVTAANRLTLAGRAQVFSSTAGPGAGGEVDVRAGRLTFAGAPAEARVFTRAERTGGAGDVRVDAVNLTAAADGPRVLSVSYGAAPAGRALVNGAPALRPAGAVVRDGSLGPGGAGALTKDSAGVYTIDDADGMLSTGGTRLFHSFSRFDLALAETANFTGPPTVQTVLARVTGGAASQVDGTLATDIPGADLYLLNPAGVVFGPDARLDVAGSLAVSTASFVRLADGTRFDAGGAGLPSAPGAGAGGVFGFAGAPAGGVLVDGANLSLPPGQTLSLVGGPVELRGGSESVTGGVQIAGGRVNLISAAGAGEVRLDPFDIDAAAADVTGVPALGPVTVSALAGPRYGLDAGPSPGLTLAPSIAPAGAIRLTGPAGGKIVVRGDRFTAADARMAAVTEGPTGGGGANGRGVDVDVAGDVLLSRANFDVRSTGDGNAGGVFINAGGAVSLVNRGGSAFAGVDPFIERAGLFTGSEGNVLGRGGNVEIRAGALSMLDGAMIATDSRGFAGGGDVTLVAEQVTLADARVTPDVFPDEAGQAQNFDEAAGTVLRSGTAAAAPGAGGGGTLLVRADTLDMRPGSTLTSRTSGAGNAGDIDVAARRVLVSSDPRIHPRNTATGISAAASRSVAEAVGETGRAGNVQIRAGEIRLSDRAQIQVRTSNATGQGGSVLLEGADIEASGDLTQISARSQQGATGGGGSVTVRAGSLKLRDGATIAVTTSSAAAGGNLDVEASTLEMSNRARVRSTSESFGEGVGGVGGNLSVRAGAIRLRDDSRISSASTGSGGGGGNLSVQAGLVHLDGQSRIDATSSGRGDGGSLDVVADSIKLERASRVSADSTADGRGGNMSLTAREIRVLSDSVVALVEEGTAFGGRDLSLTAERLEVADGGKVTGSTFGTASAGVVRISAGSVFMDDGEIAASSFGDGLGGGRVAIRAGSVELAGASSISAGNTLSDARGGVAVEAGSLVLRDTARIEATGGEGLPGAIGVQAVFDLPGEALEGEEPFRAPVDVFAVSPSGRRFRVASTIVDGTPLGVNASAIPASDLAGEWRLLVGDGSDAALSTLTRWGVVFGGQFIGATDTAVSGNTYSSAVNVGGATTPATPGAGGDIQIVADRVRMSGRASIAASTGGFGPAGTAVLQAGNLWIGDFASVQSASERPPTVLLADGERLGNAGAVSLSSERSMVIQGSPLVNVRSGDGGAGSVSLASKGTIEIVGTAGPRSARVTAEAPAGTGGNIVVTAGKSVRARNASITAESQTGGGAQIGITSPSVVLADSIINGRAAAEDVAVTIGSAGFVKSTDSTILSDAVSVPVEVDIAGALARLPAEQVGRDAKLEEACGVRLGVPVSSFVTTGRGGAAPTPGGWSPSILTDRPDGAAAPTRESGGR